MPLFLSFIALVLVIGPILIFGVLILLLVFGLRRHHEPARGRAEAGIEEETRAVQELFRELEAIEEQVEKLEALLIEGSELPARPQPRTEDNHDTLEPKS